MKRYIKAAVVTDIYLKDWIAMHRNCPYIINIDDRTPYTGDWERSYDDTEYIDCPGVVFSGTYDQLISGGGDNLLFETCGIEEYQNRLNKYYIIEEKTIEFRGKPEIYLEVYSE